MTKSNPRRITKENLRYRLFIFNFFSVFFPICFYFKAESVLYVNLHPFKDQVQVQVAPDDLSVPTHKAELILCHLFLIFEAHYRALRPFP